MTLIFRATGSHNSTCVTGTTYWCHELDLTRSHDVIDHMAIRLHSAVLVFYLVLVMLFLYRCFPSYEVYNAVHSTSQGVFHLQLSHTQLVCHVAKDFPEGRVLNGRMTRRSNMAKVILRYVHRAILLDFANFVSRDSPL